MISIQNGLWKLQGYDTFAHEYYLLDGEFDTEAEAIMGVFAQPRSCHAGHEGRGAKNPMWEEIVPLLVGICPPQRANPHLPQGKSPPVRSRHARTSSHRDRAGLG